MIQIHLIAVYRGSSHALMWGTGSEETRATDGKIKRVSPLPELRS
jgi:hypothetical protein